MDIQIHLHIRGGFCLWKSIEYLAVWRTCDGVLNFCYRCNSSWFIFLDRLIFGMTWGICQALKSYLAVSCTTKSTVIHGFSIQCPRIASSIISSLLQHHYHTVFWSMRPSLKLSKSVTLQLISGFDGKNIRQRPLYKGVGLLHYLHSIISSSKSPRGQTIKTDDRGPKDVTVRCQIVVDKMSRNLFLPPSTGFILDTQTSSKKVE